MDKLFFPIASSHSIRSLMNNWINCYSGNDHDESPTKRQRRQSDSTGKQCATSAPPKADLAKSSGSKGRYNKKRAQGIESGVSPCKVKQEGDARQKLRDGYAAVDENGSAIYTVPLAFLQHAGKYRCVYRTATYCTLQMTGLTAPYVVIVLV